MQASIFKSFFLLRLFFLLFFLLGLGCKEDSIRVYQAPKEAAPIQKSTAPFDWQTPPHWQVTQSSGMRLASFKLSDGPHHAELSVVALPGHVGGLEANISRWRQQLELPPQVLDTDHAQIPWQESSLTVVELVNPSLSKRLITIILPHVSI